MLKRAVFFFALSISAGALAADPWPVAVAPITKPLSGKFTLDRTTFVPNFDRAGERTFQKTHQDGEVHVGPQGYWYRVQQKEMPCDEVHVGLKGQRPLEFQIDSRAEMTIEPVGLFRPNGSTVFMIGEPFGWSDLSLGGSAPKRTIRETLATFRFESVENGVYRGKTAKGVEVEIETDQNGARLRRIEIRVRDKGFTLTRRTEYSAWQKVGDRTIPTAGTCSYRADFIAEGIRESDVATFKLTDLKADASLPTPPFQEGMLFRDLNTSGPPKAFRYQKGKYVPTTDPGNVYIPGRLKKHESSPVAPILVVMGAVGAVVYYWRRRVRASMPTQ